MARVADGPDARGWSERDAALVRAVDELIDGPRRRRRRPGPRSSADFGVDALLEIVFVVGHYTMLSMVANTAGVPGEPDWSPLPYAWRRAAAGDSHTSASDAFTRS